MTLKTISATPSHMMNICGRSKYIASHERDVNGRSDGQMDGRTDVRPENTDYNASKTFVTVVRKKMKIS